MTMETATVLNGSKPPARSADALPDPEVRPQAAQPQRAKRRTFSAEYKRRIVREADQCNEPGQVGALLRREGLYSSHLTDWRRQQAAGQLAGSKTTKRGRKAKQTTEQKENARLRRENERLRQQLAQAELIIDAQKKVAELLELVSQRENGQR